MREKIYRFMQGRYGIDEFSRVLVTVALLLILLSSFLRLDFLYIIGVMLIVYGYFRVFSKNYPKRYRENQKFLFYINKIKNFFRKKKDIATIRKTHHVYSCPTCKQRIKIPRGKGKIEITCPMCQRKFIKKS